MTEARSLNEKQLESNIFQVERSKKKGFKAFLNINSLPQLFACLKSELSPLENSCLNEYELQNYLIELCFLPNKFNKLRAMKEQILFEIRNTNKFWILNSDVYSQILLKQSQTTVEQSVNEENNEKTAKVDTNAEGIETYVRFISQISTLKRKYTYIREDMGFEEQEFNKKKEEEPLKTEAPEEKTQDQPEKNPSSNLETTNQELFERFLQFNDTQRLTRHQKKRLYDDSNVCSQDFNKFIDQKSKEMKKKRDEEIKNSIFMPNRYLKHPKIEFQVFPYVYRFLDQLSSVPLTRLCQFHLQNFLFFLLLQEKLSRKKFRMNQNLYSENQKEEVLEGETSENNSVDEGMLAEFYKFCHNDGFLVENVFVNDSQFKSKQKVLLLNVLLLGRHYIKQKQSSSSKDKDLQENASESDHMFYQTMLEELENYETLEEDLAIKLVDFYISEIERQKLQADRNAETLHQYLVLNENFNKDTINGVMGGFSSIERVNEAMIGYEEAINSPSMRKKRAYKFHSEDRGEWTESIYKRFLEGLLKFYDNSINNKKIAKYIGNSISANQVKFVKGKYLRKLKKRSKDLRIPTKELLTQDIEGFDIRTFDFITQNTKRR